MKNFLLIIILIGGISISASTQTLVSDVLSVGGVSDNPQLTWTMGEISTETYTAGGYTLSQGFQQPEMSSIIMDIIQSIALNAGWNTISSYVQPFMSDMLDILSPIEDETILLKNAGGEVVFPEFDINGIGDWNIKEGYQIKLKNNLFLNVQGTKIDYQTTAIPIVEGWQIIPYLKDHPKNIATQLNSISDEIILVKDNEGNVFVPSLFNNIGDMQPGQGYFLKAKSNTVLIYPDN